MKQKNLLSSIRKTLANIISPDNNSMSLPQQFLRYGNKGMKADWSEVVMSDQDLYTGYGYGAIRNRANLTARVAMDNVITDSKLQDYTHPYLDIINDSRSFPDYKFWSDISTYLDLEGVYYLLAVRAVEKDENGNIIRIGKIKEFRLLNPYNVRRIMDTHDLNKVAGYIETRNGMIRELPSEMIIEIRELNPFSDRDPWSMTDAAKESQFTLKTAGDYTRHSLRNNINAPGIMSTDVVLEEEEFTKFMQRVRSHTKGEPIFGNGQGAVTWESMQVDLSKSALKEVNEINRESLFAVSGVSKTIMGVEQSGVTRETSKVQKDLIIENQILPRIQLIVDSLNQDYENNYTGEYFVNKASIIVNNPVGADYDAETKELDVKTKKYELFSKLINRDVDPVLAGQYIKGEKELEDLGMTKMELPVIEPKNDGDSNKDDTNNSIVENKAEDTRPLLVKQQEGSLMNTVKSIENELVSNMISRLDSRKKLNIVNVNIDDETELITKSKKNEFKKSLAFALGAFYGVVTQFKGNETAKERTKKYAMMTVFKMNKGIESRIKDLSKKVSESHIDTVVKDVYETAKASALRGSSIEQVERDIRKKYNETISDSRAKTIARTETNRAFTIAQYEADKQFISQNNLEGKVFKQWHTRSDNPCNFCRALEDEGPIPFSKNFRDLGDNITIGENTLRIEFEHLQAGNAHPNCNCDYELILETSDNSINMGDIDSLQKAINSANEVLSITKSKAEAVNLKEKELNERELELELVAGELEKIL